MSRPRILPYPAWLMVATLFLVAGGAVFHYWREYQLVRDLVQDVKSRDGAANTTYEEGDWLVEFAHKTGLVNYVEWREIAISEIMFANETVDDEWLRRLRPIKTVYKLHLEDCRITDAGLESIAHLKSLEHLDLSNTQVTSSGLGLLKGLGNLRFLSLRDTQVSDTGLENLIGLQNLDTLSLSNTQVGDAGLIHLEKMKGHIRVDLTGTHVTASGVLRLKSHRPDLIIEN